MISRTDLLSMDDVTMFYCVAPNTVRLWVKQGMPHVTAEKTHKISFLYNDIEIWLNQDFQVHGNERYLIKGSELAEELGFCPQYMHHLRKRHDMPHYLLRGKTYRYDYKEVFEWFENRVKWGRTK